MESDKGFFRGSLGDPKKVHASWFQSHSIHVWYINLQPNVG